MSDSFESQRSLCFLQIKKCFVYRAMVFKDLEDFVQNTWKKYDFVSFNKKENENLDITIALGGNIIGWIWFLEHVTKETCYNSLFLAK